MVGGNADMENGFGIPLLLCFGEFKKDDRRTGRRSRSFAGVL